MLCSGCRHVVNNVFTSFVSTEIDTFKLLLFFCQEEQHRFKMCRFREKKEIKRTYFYQHDGDQLLTVISVLYLLWSFFSLPSINSFAPVLNRDCVCKEKPMNWNVKNKYSWLWLTGKQHCWGGNCFIDTLPNNMWNFTYPSTSIVSGMRKTFNGRVNIYKFGWFLWLYSRKWQHRITLVDFFFKGTPSKKEKWPKGTQIHITVFSFFK